MPPDEDLLGFPETNWTAVINAKDRASGDYREQLGKLISLYWEPVYKYIRYIWSESDHDASDLTQEFFSTFLEKDRLQSVSADKGRFRTYVKAVLKHYLIDLKRKASAQKRGGEQSKISIENLDENYLKSETDDIFDKEWARTVIARSVETLRRRLENQGKEVYFKVFDLYDLKKNKDTTRATIAKKAGIKETDVNNYVFYCRRLLGKLIRKEVSGYTLNQNDADEELRYLLSLRF